MKAFASEAPDHASVDNLGLRTGASHTAHLTPVPLFPSAAGFANKSAAGRLSFATLSGFNT